MAQSLFYDKGGVRITKTLFEYGNSQYQIRNINTVSVYTKNPDRQGPIWCIVIGFLAIVAYGLGLLIIGVGIFWWISQKPLFILMLDTSSGQVQGLSHEDSSVIAEVRSALNAAMEQQ